MSAITAAAILTTLAVVAIMAYPEQKIAAENIRRAFLKNIRYAILWALCQAGKTGAYHELIRLMLEYGDVDHVYILCGSSEVELRIQAIDDAKKYNGKYYKDGTIKIFFHQDFKKSQMDIRNALIVVDESHLVQGKEQQLKKFLEKHGLSMDGNPTTLNRENAYILSVDATPYSEIAALKHKESYEKHVEIMDPGEGYFGVADYYYSGRIRPTFNISSNPNKFAKLFKSKQKKYAIIRLSSDNEQEDAIKAICLENGFKLRYNTIDAKEKQIEIKELKNEPLVNTVVIIRGRFRAGKVIDKKHIAFVWEGSKTANTDTLIQGLLGRMCGYEFGDEKPLIFVPSSCLVRDEKKEIKMCEIERAIQASTNIIPRKATNLKKCAVANLAANGKTQITPLRINLGPIDADEYEVIFDLTAPHDSRREPLRNVLNENMHLIDTLNCSEDQKDEIRGFIDSAIPYFRDYRSTSAASSLSYYKAMLEAHKTGTTTTEHISNENPQMTFLLAHPGFRGLREPGANQRHIYVIFYTTANAGVNPGLLAVNLKSRVAPTNGESHFSINSSAFDEEPCAISGAYMVKSNLESPATLKAYLDNYMRTWQASVLSTDPHRLNYTRSVSTTKDAFRLSKSAFNWTGKNKSDVEKIALELGIKYGVKIIVKYSRGRTAEGFFNLKTISW